MRGARRRRSAIIFWLGRRTSAGSPEIVRAAKLSNATRVEIDFDADDLRVTWDGDAWDAATLTRLETHVFTEGPSERRIHLFAVGVFAALGHEAKWIEVFSRRADGAVDGIRYQRRELDAGNDGEPLGAHPPANHAPPANLRTMAIHVKRSTTWSVVSRFVTRAEPPERSLSSARASPRAR